MKYVIGLMGNMGSGKSTVLGMLGRLGARIIDADALAHQVMARGTAVWQDIVDSFGDEILDDEGQVDRHKLGSIVFHDRGALRRLEEIVHPAIDEIFMDVVENSEEPVIAVEAVKLIESGIHRELNSLWLVTCPAEERLRRLVESRGSDPEEVRKRLEAQMTEERQAQYADVVIDNSRDLEYTWEQVKVEWVKVQERICCQT